jgi:protein subunit release factor B
MWQNSTVLLKGNFAKALFENEFGIVYATRTIPVSRETAFKVSLTERNGNDIRFELTRAEFEVCVLAFRNWSIRHSKQATKSKFKNELYLNRS